MAKLSFGQLAKSSPKPLTRRDVRIVLAGAGEMSEYPRQNVRIDPGETSDTTGETSELTAQTTELTYEFALRNLRNNKEKRILRKQFGRFAGQQPMVSPTSAAASGAAAPAQ
jgi:hypothetical protein